jgi:hypothetical protein
VDIYPLQPAVLPGVGSLKRTPAMHDPAVIDDQDLARPQTDTLDDARELHGAGHRHEGTFGCWSFPRRVHLGRFVRED